MLEYMLIRPTDRSLLHQATRALKFLAVDEVCTSIAGDKVRMSRC